MGNAMTHTGGTKTFHHKLEPEKYDQTRYTDEFLKAYKEWLENPKSIKKIKKEQKTRLRDKVLKFLKELLD